MTISKGKRFKIFNRDNFTCQYCGLAGPKVVLHIDHKFPVSKGGTDDEENLLTACQACNIGKGATLIKGGKRTTAIVGLGWVSDGCPYCDPKPLFCLPLSCEWGDRKRRSIVFQYECDRHHRWTTGYDAKGIEQHARSTRDEFRASRGKIKLYPERPIPNLTPVEGELCQNIGAVIHPSVPWDRRWRMEFVELRGGLTLPVEILEFALRLEARGVHLQANGDILKVTADEGKPVLSEEEVAFIRNRKVHLMAVAAYQAPASEESSPAAG